MTSAFWGPKDGVDSNDYKFLMQGETPTSRPSSIVGHALSSPSQELTDALRYTTVELKRGKIVQVRRTKRPAREIGRTYPIGFPSALMTPLLNRVQLGLRTTLYLLYLCPEDPNFEHAFVLPEAVINPPVEAEDLITTSDDAVIITRTADAEVEEVLTVWAVGWFKQATITDGGATFFRDIQYRTEECADQTTVAINQDFVAGGGFANVGSGPTGTLVRTDDRFATTTITNPADTADDHIQAIYTEGDLVVIVDDASADFSALSAQVQYSLDGGDTFVASTGIASPVYAFAAFDDLLVAVGKGGTPTATGPSGMWISDDMGATWTEATSTNLNVADVILRDVAYDESTGRLYMVGTDSVGTAGVLLVATKSGDSITVADLSANLVGSPTGLNSVMVLEEGHIAVAGLAGYFAESTDDGVTWDAVSVGTASDIVSADGTVHRTVVTTASSILVRDILTDNLFKTATLENGATLTGNITKVRVNPDPDHNSFILSTDAGEIIQAVPFYPDA